jgi:hypothetical protein
MKRHLLFSMVFLFLVAAWIAACYGPPSPARSGGQPTATQPRNRATGSNAPTVTHTIESFEECARAGYPILESYPRQCRTPDGKSFTESIETSATAAVSTVVPEDPAASGLYKYPDEPLDSIPSAPISVRYLVEHRSALNRQVVRVRGVVVATLLGEKACPPDMGMCAQPSLFLADTSAGDRDKNYDVRVLVGEQEQESDYPVSGTVEMRGAVLGDKSTVVLQKVY